MSTTQTTKRKRGRPATGKARSAAERMRDTRARALKAVKADSSEGEDLDLSAVSTTGLLEVVRVSVRKGTPWLMVDAVSELFERSNAKAETPVAVTFSHAREVENSATVAEKQPKETQAKSETVAENKGKAQSYPTEVKAMAVDLADAGKPTAEVRAAILDSCGRAPDISNLARLVRRWRAAIAKTAS